MCFCATTQIQTFASNIILCHAHERENHLDMSSSIWMMKCIGSKHVTLKSKAKITVLLLNI